jgi:antirestriction protein ArdC
MCWAANLGFRHWRRRPGKTLASPSKRHVSRHVGPRCAGGAHRDQCCQWYTPKPDADAPIEQRIESADAFFGRVGARVAHQGNRAFYCPADDTITLPPFAAFHTPLDYYSTRAHETGHWTGKAERCNRELGKRFGDNAYSMEANGVKTGETAALLNRR